MTGLSPAKSYTFKVAVVSSRVAGGTGPFSESVNVTTPQVGELVGMICICMRFTAVQWTTCTQVERLLCTSIDLQSAFDLVFGSNYGLPIATSKT